jgi:hypothetical protein
MQTISTKPDQFSYYCDICKLKVLTKQLVKIDGIPQRDDIGEGFVRTYRITGYFHKSCLNVFIREQYRIYFERLL